MTPTHTPTLRPGEIPVAPHLDTVGAARPRLALETPPGPPRSPRPGTREPGDPRLQAPGWDASPPDRRRRVGIRLVVCALVPLAVFYFAWLLQPERVGHPVLYGLLVAAELFNLAQAVGFWWTCLRDGPARRRAFAGPPPRVDVFIPVYDEPVDIVEATVEHAMRLDGHGAEVDVHLLDDGKQDAMRALALRHGADYIRRPVNTGAKAGNINHALKVTTAPYVVVLDCDHVPHEDLLVETLGHFDADGRVAFVQTPQYYANSRGEGSTAIAEASWAQQALFFGPIARGKAGHDAMFCCGTNVVFARAALEDAGGFPEDTVTEDFELSIRLHSRGWRTAYVPRVLASGLGPEDMASYVSQQQRWARGCLSAIGAALRARGIPWRTRAQYLLSASYFLSGWTVLIYMAFPAARILTGAQPLAQTTADQFLLHFAPYFGLALFVVSLLGQGSYTFRAFALQTASFWIHVQATVLALLRRRGKFVVTPKQGAASRQPRAVWPALVMLAALFAVAVYGLAHDQSPATLNNVAFAALHLTVLTIGVAPALSARRTSP